MKRLFIYIPIVLAASFIQAVDYKTRDEIISALREISIRAFGDPQNTGKTSVFSKRDSQAPATLGDKLTPNRDTWSKWQEIADASIKYVRANSGDNKDLLTSLAAISKVNMDLINTLKLIYNSYAIPAFNRAVEEMESNVATTDPVQRKKLAKQIVWQKFKLSLEPLLNDEQRQQVRKLATKLYNENMTLLDETKQKLKAAKFSTIFKDKNKENSRDILNALIAVTQQVIKKIHEELV